MKRVYTLGIATTFAALSAPMASAQHISPRAVIEHVEGVVYVDQQRLEPPAASNFGNKGGSVVRTEDGRAVIRLEDGMLFLGENSSVRVIDRPYALVQLGMLTGSAVVITETAIGSAAVVACEEPVTLSGSGVYRFDAKRVVMPGQEDYTYCRFRVYKGAAAVQLPSFISVLTSGKTMNLNHVCGDHVQTNVFDIEEIDGLDRWSRQHLVADDRRQ
jgi:hypothetical protein